MDDGLRAEPPPEAALAAPLGVDAAADSDPGVPSEAMLLMSKISVSPLASPRKGSSLTVIAPAGAEAAAVWGGAAATEPEASVRPAAEPEAEATVGVAAPFAAASDFEEEAPEALDEAEAFLANAPDLTAMGLPPEFSQSTGIMGGMPGGRISGEFVLGAAAGGGPGTLGAVTGGGSGALGGGGGTSQVNLLRQNFVDNHFFASLIQECRGTTATLASNEMRLRTMPALIAKLWMRTPTNFSHSMPDQCLGGWGGPGRWSGGGLTMSMIDLSRLR